MKIFLRKYIKNRAECVMPVGLSADRGETCLLKEGEILNACLKTSFLKCRQTLPVNTSFCFFNTSFVTDSLTQTKVIFLHIHVALIISSLSTAI